MLPRIVASCFVRKMRRIFASGEVKNTFAYEGEVKESLSIRELLRKTAQTISVLERFES